MASARSEQEEPSPKLGPLRAKGASAWRPGSAGGAETAPEQGLGAEPEPGAGAAARAGAGSGSRSESRSREREPQREPEPGAGAAARAGAGSGSRSESRSREREPQREPEPGAGAAARAGAGSGSRSESRSRERTRSSSWAGWRSTNAAERRQRWQDPGGHPPRLCRAPAGALQQLLSAAGSLSCCKEALVELRAALQRLKGLSRKESLSLLSGPLQLLKRSSKVSWSLLLSRLSSHSSLGLPSQQSFSHPLLMSVACSGTPPAGPCLPCAGVPQSWPQQSRLRCAQSRGADGSQAQTPQAAQGPSHTAAAGFSQILLGSDLGDLRAKAPAALSCMPGKQAPNQVRLLLIAVELPKPSTKPLSMQVSWVASGA
ncbi:uncharacterized protein LOC135184713 [Pogoniulus pusillus]|uniref:uncharacterized protein LOC135184713 n=1 Tax=Pogoniulus pusillus TaxID=488313 RepID=UPI0030B94BE5